MWSTIVVLVARLIFAALFAMAATFKVLDPAGTAAMIEAAGFPLPLLLAYLAAALEIVLVFCFLSGALFSEAALVAAAYVLFLAFTFHGPGRWAGSPTEFPFFIDHFTFIAGLLFAAAHGPGERLALPFGLLRRA
jgi:putative oxidoreductase